MAGAGRGVGSVSGIEGGRGYRGLGASRGLGCRASGVSGVQQGV